MTTAIILGIIAVTCVVFALGAYAGRDYGNRQGYQRGYDHGHDMGHADGYGEGYEQGRHDARMDAANPDDAHAELYGQAAP